MGSDPAQQPLPRLQKVPDVTAAAAIKALHPIDCQDQKGLDFTPLTTKNFDASAKTPPKIVLEAEAKHDDLGKVQLRADSNLDVKIHGEVNRDALGGHPGMEAPGVLP